MTLLIDETMVHAAEHVPPHLYSAMVGAPRWVLRHPDGSPYLTRWVLLGCDALDNHDPAIPQSAFVHRLHTADGDRHLHSHPWPWSHGHVLSGGYTEKRCTMVYGDRGPDYITNVVKLTYGPRTVNVLNNSGMESDYHSIVHVEPNTYTLFIVGPETSGWGFLVGTAAVPHKEYFKRPDAQKMTHARER